MEILSCNTSWESAKLLKTNIEELTGKDVFLTHWPHKCHNLIARYGNSSPLPFGFSDTIYNSSSFIRLSTNKLAFSEKLSAEDIFVPKFYRNVYPDKYPVLIRKTLTGCAGNGIVICKNRQDFDNAGGIDYYWTPYVETDFEIRAYCIEGEITQLFVKTPFENQVNDEIRVRSEYHYSIRQNIAGMYNKLRAQLRKIYEITQGEFFAADCGFATKERDYICFEVNSGPWMNKDCSMRHAQFLVKKLGL